MQYICHRINRFEELENVPDGCGVELDLRDDLDGSIYIEHNPFTPGQHFEEYLKHYNKGLMILNIKSERIEEPVLELIKKYGVTSYFFLDSSFPMIYLLSQKGITQTALRFSEFEGLDTAVKMAGRCEWIWVDCFTKMPLDRESYELIKSCNYKICIVSPELQGQPEKLEEYAGYLAENRLIPDAVCTKYYNIDKWKHYLRYLGE